MHVPPRLGDLASVNSLAKEPEASAFRIFCAEIIARRPVGSTPPLGGDALRPFDGGDLMHRAPPFETQRRPIGDFGDRLDRLKPFEEAQRPRWRDDLSTRRRAPSTMLRMVPLPRRAGEEGAPSSLAERSGAGEGDRAQRGGGGSPRPQSRGRGDDG